MNNIPGGCEALRLPMAAATGRLKSSPLPEIYLPQPGVFCEIVPFGTSDGAGTVLPKAGACSCFGILLTAARAGAMQ
jgi:hypothetical protein